MTKNIAATTASTFAIISLLLLGPNTTLGKELRGSGPRNANTNSAHDIAATVPAAERQLGHSRLPPCTKLEYPSSGVPMLFEAGYGSCSTYSPSYQSSNYNWCSSDFLEDAHNGKVYASDACAECGQCENEEEPTPVCPATEPSSGDSCNWQALGSCDYNEIFCCGESAGFSTFAYCSPKGEVLIAMSSIFCDECKEEKDDWTCPPNVPNLGEPCDWQGSCDYNEITCCEGGGGFETTATCSSSGDVMLVFALIMCENYC